LSSNEVEGGSHGLARRLNLFDAAMLVMGGIIGSGIFVTPSEVARHVGTPFLIVGVWVLGGVVFALAGAFVYAELAVRRPALGGQYAYLRDAYGPLPAFLYGWSLLLVIQSGGMAAVAITFARYVNNFARLGVSDTALAIAAVALLTLVNCLGVRSGSNVQSLLMVLKILAIAALVGVGLWFAPHPGVPSAPTAAGGLSGVGAALVPVIFSYGGWQTASFVAAELRDPDRDLARGMLLGVMGVILLYTLLVFVCVHALGPQRLAASTTPASDVMRLSFGKPGATFIAIGIAISALGFLSQGMLTAPRVYFAMAEDGLFFRSVGKLSKQTRVPVVAILLQGAVTSIIALSGTFGQILSYVVSVDLIFFALTGAAVFVFRRRPDASAHGVVPGHPFTTVLFVGSCMVVIAATIWNTPMKALFGYAILVAGVPAFLYWQRKKERPA
jgi:APA family basic amino acid/polyamine antiporter